MQVFQGKKPSICIKGGGSFMEHLADVFAQFKILLK